MTTAQGTMTTAEAVLTAADAVFGLWCRLTGSNPDDFGVDERESFLARPQIAELSSARYQTLLAAGRFAGRRNSLPLERWLTAVRAGRTPRLG